MNNVQYDYQQTTASQMPIITSGQTGITTTGNEQRVDQEGDNYITNDNVSVDQLKPSFTYKSLIGQAILASPDEKRQLKEIRKWIAETYPFYKTENESWKNAIRHNLTLCPAFHRCERKDGTTRKKAWTIPNKYRECFINGVYINYKAKEIKAREESAAFGSGEIRRSDVQKPTPPPRLSASSPNLSTAPTQSISGSGSILRPAPRQSELAYNRYMQENSYLIATEAVNSSLQAPYNYVNMSMVENIQNTGFLNYEIETDKTEMTTWELGVTEYCSDTGLEYVPESPDFIYTDSEN
ncbi:3629_t:CDS:2 [Diversispora eburnea]|uniref:3629_t:CDS:1 n=1 Tax=Diversispora eburnea TaxID=1213867 RepID=A0A9N9FLG9_9GLOM|nr:3629_t:CDS:2 [Diversispora eburnea]